MLRGALSVSAPRLLARYRQAIVDQVSWAMGPRPGEPAMEAPWVI